MRNPNVKRFLTGVAVLGALGWTMACSSDSSTESHVHAVASMTVTPEVDTTIVGQAVQFSVTAKCHCGDTLTDRTITWQSSNPAVALVSQTGLVTGVSVGRAELVASSAGREARVTIDVVAPAALSLSFDTVWFDARAGESDPPPDSVAITNGGELELTGLSVDSIVFGAGASGWVAAQVTSTVAPA